MISEESLTVDPFNRPWTILSLAQADEFQSRYPSSSSVHGNFSKVRDRLRPDAYLLVECRIPAAPNYLDAYDYAETILGALCVTSLLSPENPAGTRQYAPRPIYLTRTPEYCDLPLVIDTNGVRLVGHSSPFAWLSPDDGTMFGRVSSGELSKMIAAAPGVARDILSGVALPAGWQQRVQGGARALHAAFQAASPGQFVANMATVAEMLVNARSNEYWWQRKNRLKVLVGPTYWTRVEEVMSARHDYVHEAKQPASAYLAFGALGLAVHTWSVLHELCEARGDVRTVLNEIDSLASSDPPNRRTTSDLSPAQVASLNACYVTVPRGPLRQRHWINQALTDVHPNDYYKRFSVFGSVSCSGCGAFLTEQHRVAQTSETETFVCSMCKGQTDALLPFSSSR